MYCLLPYLVHVELAHIKNSITLDWNEIWARNLHHCTALIKVAKSLAPSNVIGHGKVLYQKPRLKSMAHAVHPPIEQCISTMCSANVNGVYMYVACMCSHSDN